MGGACGAGKELGFTLGGAAGALGLLTASSTRDCGDADSSSAGGAFAGKEQPAKTKAAMSGGKIDFGIPVMLVWPYVTEAIPEWSFEGTLNRRFLACQRQVLRRKRKHG